MTWTRAETGQANDDFRQVLSECEDYVPHIEMLMPKLNKPHRQMWYWESTGNVRQALCFSLRESSAKILVGTPSPEGSAIFHGKTMVGKLRREMDLLGVSDWRTTTLVDYSSEHMAEFIDHLDRLWHEVRYKTQFNERRQFVFDRKESNKKDDNKFEGIGKDRPPRTKRRP